MTPARCCTGSPTQSFTQPGPKQPQPFFSFVNFRAVEDHQEGSYRLCQKTQNFSKLLKDKEQEKRVTHTVRLGFIVLDCCWPNCTYTKLWMKTDFTLRVLLLLLLLPWYHQTGTLKRNIPTFMYWQHLIPKGFSSSCPVVFFDRTDFPVNTKYEHGQGQSSLKRSYVGGDTMVC